MSVEPALTAEEWAKGEYVRPSPSAKDLPTRIATLEADGVDINGYVDYCYGVVVADRERHVLAALCLHGQPFGFTHEDVAMLRALSWWKEKFRGRAHGEYYDDIGTEADRCAALADRIEALLPPKAEK